MGLIPRTQLLQGCSATAPAHNQTLQVFQTAVLPWCRATYALSGAALVHLESINRHFIYHEPSFLYFTKQLSIRVHASGTLLSWVHASSTLLSWRPLAIAYRHFHADALLRGLLRHLTQLPQAPVVAGSFAVAECLRRQDRYGWRPNDIDIFVDDPRLYFHIIDLFDTTICKPLGLTAEILQTQSSESDDESEVVSTTFSGSDSDDESVYTNPSPPIDPCVPGVWGVQEVRRCIARWLESDYATTCFPNPVLDELRKVPDHLPPRFQRPQYRIIQAARCHFTPRSRMPPTLMTPNIVLVNPRPAHVTSESTSFAEHICSNFDMTLCSVWLRVTAELQYISVAMQDAATALHRREIHLRPTSFVPAPRDICVEDTVMRSMCRVAKYVGRGFHI